MTRPSSDPPIPHVSYSSLNDWLKCGKYYELKKILNLPEAPAWWNVGGTAVHAASEEVDKILYLKQKARKLSQGALA